MKPKKIKNIVDEYMEDYNHWNDELTGWKVWRKVIETGEPTYHVSVRYAREWIEEVVDEWVEEHIDENLMHCSGTTQEEIDEWRDRDWEFDLELFDVIIQQREDLVDTILIDMRCELIGRV